MANMTRKDYELIAFCVRNGKDKAHIAQLLTAELMSKNPRFDPNKFLVACGVERAAKQRFDLLDHLKSEESVGNYEMTTEQENEWADLKKTFDPQ